MNAEFGGFSPASSKVFYLHGSVDPSLRRRAVIIPGATHVMDMYPPATTDFPALAEAKTEVIEQMAVWLRDGNCTGQCGPNGRCVVDTCVCAEGFAGVKCEKEVTAKRKMIVVIICAAVIPVVLVLVVALLGWACCWRRRDTGHIALSTSS
jgi:hypothetical protein